jgi:hypothetical protein
MRDLQKSSKFGTEKTNYPRLLWGWHCFVSKSPGGFVNNPGQVFFLFTHARGTRLWTKNAAHRTPNSCIQIPTASFLHLIHCPELTKIRALPIRSEKRSALRRAIIF